jgi:hypothetical protein
MRHAGTLSAVIAEELGREADDLACSALARFVLEVPTLAKGRHDPRSTVETVFDLLIHGWQSQQDSGDAITRSGKS